MVHGFDDTPAGAALRISVAAHHRVKTLTVREPLMGLVRSGTKSLCGVDAEQRYRSGEIFLVGAGTQWDVVNDPTPGGHYVADVLAFSQALLNRFHEIHPQAQRARAVQAQQRLACDAELEEALRRAALCLTAEGHSRALQQHRLIEALLLLSERGWVFAPGQPHWDERVRRLIAHRLHARWTIADLAEAFHTSASTLRRRLAEQGLTLGELVREVRMETALALLQSTTLGVGEVAARCGYESHSSFSSAFRQRFGFAPSDLRPAVAPAMNSAEQNLALAN